MNLLNILKPVSEVFAAKMDLKRTEVEAKGLAMMEAAKRGESWESSAAQNAANSWADEYWTAVLSLPLIAVFFPMLQPYVADGFEALKAIPEFYKWWAGASISFAFARRSIPDFFTKVSRK
jgi:hypothetical protein